MGKPLPAIDQLQLQQERQVALWWCQLHFPISAAK